MKVRNIYSGNILLNEKSCKTCKNILIYDISYKTFLGLKPLVVRFDQIDEFIKIYDGIRYLVLFCFRLYDAIYKRIRHLISKKHAITDSTNHNISRIRIDSYSFLPIDETLTFHNVIKHIKSVVVNKNKNNY